MNNLDIIFNKSKEIYSKNLKIQQQRDKTRQDKIEQQEKDKQFKREKKVINYNYETDCYSKELLQLIKKFNFTIESYEKFTEFGEHDYEPTLEIYYCKFNQWRFEIHNYSDVDIEEGIFALNNIKNISTDEEIDFYCDLGCRNTGKDRLNEILDFLTYNSLQEYINNKYHKYIILSELLQNKGYNAEKIDYKFKLNEPKGYLKLDKNLFVKVYRAWHSDFKFVVTNDKSWDVNSANDSVCNYGKKAYFFNYNSESDIDELCKCIEAFKDDQSGKIGFYENGEYYNNNDLLSFYSSLRTKENYYKDCWNYSLIQLKHEKYWDCRGYDEDNSVITNKYKGLEIYLKTELTFNDASQWSIGEYVNKSIILFEYDKRKNNKQCRLKIENYIYDSKEGYKINIGGDKYEDDETATEDEIINYVPDKNKLSGNIDIYGTFTELFKILQDYVYKMCEIHKIKL